MHMHMYLHMSPSSFLMAVFGEESILGTCSRRNKHYNFGAKVKTSTFGACPFHNFSYYSPNSVHTVGVLAVTLGLAVCSGGKSHVFRPSTFVRRCGTSCMSPRSRAGEKVGRATFFRKTQWFQLTFPLSPDGGPGGSRDAPDAFRGLLGVSPELSEVLPEPLLGSFFQYSPPRIPPLRFLLKKSSWRIPLLGFLPQDSIPRIPP